MREYRTFRQVGTRGLLGDGQFYLNLKKLMLSIIIGIALLYIGAEGLVRGSSSLAAHFGIPPLIVGLTIVAFGTSSPELLVSISAALRGASDVAVGNVVGSNIFNILGILGLTATILPLEVSGISLRDAGFMLGVAVLMLPSFSQKSISRIGDFQLCWKSETFHCQA